MKQNCDLCKVSSTSASPPPPSSMPLSKAAVVPVGKLKVVLDDHHHQQHHHQDEKSMKGGTKYLSAKHCSSPAESPPLKPVTTTAAAMIRTMAPANQAAAAVELGHQQQQQYHHLHPQHHQFNGFDEYYSAPLLSPSLMMDMMLAAHLLRGYYQPAGPLISSHPGGQQPQSPLKSKPDPLVGSGPTVVAGQGVGLPAAPQPVVPGQPPPQHQVHQPTPSVGLVEHHRLDPNDPAAAAAAAADLHRSQAFRYIPQPTGPYARPPIHQIHCTYPPPPPTYYTYGQHPQELCYPPSYQPYYPQKMYATAPPPPPPSAYRRYVSGSYYQGGDIYDHQSSSRLLPPPPPQPSGHPPPPSSLDQYSYYSPYASAASHYGRAVQSYLDSAPPPGSGGGAGGAGLPPPIPYQTSCPCPMQSCPKNVHTGPLIGSSSGKGPGQQHQQQQQQQQQQSGSNRTCKTEERDEYPKHNSAHYEQTVPPHSQQQQQQSQQQQQQPPSFGVTAPSYTVNTALEPEMSISPARGSTGLSMPTTPVSPSISEISSSNGSVTGSSGSNLRKARIGKNSVREQQLLRSNVVPGPTSQTQMENIYAQELPPHLQHYHHEILYNPNMYPHYDHQRYGGGPPTYLGHIHHVAQPPQPQSQPPPLPTSKEDDLYHVNTTSVKQEPVIKTERLEVKQEQVSGDDEEEEEQQEVHVVKRMAKGGSSGGGGGGSGAEKRKERSRERVEGGEGGQCDRDSVTKPNKNFTVAERILGEKQQQQQQQQQVDQCQRASDKTNAEVDGVCDITSTSSNKRPVDDACDTSVEKAESPSRRSGAGSLLRLSSTGSAEKGPKKSNYKTLIKPAEPKPYLSCAMGSSMKRADKLRKKYPNCSDRARMRLLKKRSRKHQQVISGGAGKLKRRGNVVKVKRGVKVLSTNKTAGPSLSKGKLIRRRQKEMKTMMKKKKRELEQATNESTTSEESSSPLVTTEDVAQDKNNNNTDKEMNNNVLVREDGEADGDESRRSNLDETIDLVARGHFDEEEEEAVDVIDEDHKEDDEVVSPAKKQKLDPVVQTITENAASKSKSSKSGKSAKSSSGKKSGKTDKKVEKEDEVNEIPVAVPEKPKSKAKAKKSKTAGKEKTVPEEKKVEEVAKEKSPEKPKGTEKELTETAKQVVVHTVVPEEKKSSVVSSSSSGESIAEEKSNDQVSVKASEVEAPPKPIVGVEESSSAADDLRPGKGRPGRKPKKGGLKLSSRKRKAQQRLSKALEEIPVKKHVGAPRWSNGWNWLGESFQGLVFLNSDDPPVMRTCYAAMRHMEGDIIRPRDCVLLRAGSKRNELPYVAKVAHLWENPEDGEMMMSLLWYYRPEHTEQGRQEADGGEEVFASKHKDHNSVACIEDKCYVLTFNEYCRYRRILKSVEENIDVSPSIVPALKPDQEGMLAPKVPLNTSPELVMFCYRVYEFRFKRMKNFY